MDDEVPDWAAEPTSQTSVLDSTQGSAEAVPDWATETEQASSIPDWAEPTPQSPTPQTDSALQQLNKWAQTPSPPFLRGVEEEVKGMIPRSLGAAGRMIGESATPVVGAVEDVWNTAKGLYQMSQGKPREEAFPAEKPFDQYTTEDWGRFVGKMGIQAAMAIPAFKGLRPEIRARITGEVEPKVTITPGEVGIRPEVQTRQPSTGGGLAPEQIQNITNAERQLKSGEITPEQYDAEVGQTLGPERAGQWPTGEQVLDPNLIFQEQPRGPTAIEQQPIAGGETYAVEPSITQVEAREPALGVQEGAGSEVTGAGRSDYALREAERAEAGGPVPPAAEVEPAAAGALPPPEVPKAAPPAAAAPQKPSKIGQSIEAKAVEAKLTEGFGETAGYDPITIKDQAERATSFIKSSPTDARAVIRGEATLPQGLRGTSLITAMEEHLLRKPDLQVAYELANSPLTSATSAAAQEMRLMSERVPDSMTAKFAEIQEARKAGSKLRGETPERLAKEIKTEIVKQSSKRPTWEAFVRDLTC